MCNAISKQNFCIYCLQVCSRSDLVFRSYESVTAIFVGIKSNMIDKENDMKLIAICFSESY